MSETWPDQPAGQPTGCRLLSVIIPLYNEAATVGTLVDRVLQVPVRKEVIVVDDGSTDGSVAVLRDRSLSSEPNVRLVQHERNLGKGAAIRTGLAVAAGDIILVQDADLEYDPRDYIRILEAFEQPHVYPLPGTEYYRLTMEMQLFDEADLPHGDYARPIVRTMSLSTDELIALRRKALLSFYLRPSHVVETLRGVDSPRVLFNYVKSGVRLLRMHAFDYGTASPAEPLAG